MQEPGSRFADRPAGRRVGHERDQHDHLGQPLVDPVPGRAPRQRGGRRSRDAGQRGGEERQLDQGRVHQGQWRRSAGERPIGKATFDAYCLKLSVLDWMAVEFSYEFK